jgi:hypothetical protein
VHAASPQVPRRRFYANTGHWCAYRRRIAIEKKFNLRGTNVAIG